MKLHGLARVKNEGDVIEEFVRHNLRVLDALTVVDNASFDGTRPVLDALRAEGLPLTVVHDPILPKRQYETMTRLARASAVEDDWDFLFLLDADEFVKVTDRERLEQSLAMLAPGQNGLLPWCSYVPTEHDDVREPRVLDRITYRRTTETSPTYYKCVLSRSFAEGGFTIGQGNHVAYGSGAEAPAIVLNHVTLAHFPVRSIMQVQTKALLGWGAYLAMGYDTDGYGWHQRRLFHRLESETAWSMADLYDIALRYTEADESNDVGLTHDPLEPVPELRYGNVAIASLTQFAARYVRQLATTIAGYDASGKEPQHVPTDR